MPVPVRVVVEFADDDGKGGDALPAPSGLVLVLVVFVPEVVLGRDDRLVIVGAPVAFPLCDIVDREKPPDEVITMTEIVLFTVTDPVTLCSKLPDVVCPDAVVLLKEGVAERVALTGEVEFGKVPLKLRVELPACTDPEPVELTKVGIGLRVVQVGELSLDAVGKMVPFPAMSELGSDEELIFWPEEIAEIVLPSPLLVERLPEAGSVPLMMVIEIVPLGTSSIDDDNRTAELPVLVVEDDPVVVSLTLLVTIVPVMDTLLVTVRLPLAGTLVKITPELDPVVVPETAVLLVLFVTPELVRLAVADCVLDNVWLGFTLIPRDVAVVLEFLDVNVGVSEKLPEYCGE